jgi:hypothetical protein
MKTPLLYEAGIPPRYMTASPLLRVRLSLECVFVRVWKELGGSLAAPFNVAVSQVSSMQVYEPLTTKKNVTALITVKKKKNSGRANNKCECL